jgi:hypothetical protein
MPTSEVVEDAVNRPKRKAEGDIVATRVKNAQKEVDESVSPDKQIKYLNIEISSVPVS